MLSRSMRGLERLAPAQMANARLNPRTRGLPPRPTLMGLPNPMAVDIGDPGYSFMKNTFDVGDMENHDPMGMLADAVNIHSGFNDATGRAPGMLGKGANGLNDAFSVGQAYNDPTPENVIAGGRSAASMVGSVLGKNLMGPAGMAMNIFDGGAAALNRVSPVKIPDSNQIAAGMMETGGRGVADIQQHLPGAMENVI